MNVTVKRPVWTLKSARLARSAMYRRVFWYATVVWYWVSPGGMVMLIGPKPNEPSWKVDQSRFGSSCSVTVTSWAATLPSFSKSMV